MLVSSFHTILLYLVLNNTVLAFLFVINGSAPWCSVYTFLSSLFSSHILSLLSCSLCTVGCSCVVLFQYGPLYMLLLILFVVGCFSSCVRIFSSGSVLVCLCSCSWRYCPADICVGFICCLFHVTTLPVL